ncbi:MAG TPA: FMN-binding negative transcriptional regulator [Burkholderiaceae bacterium]|nr:FMN-binding negative transcriptional regulator [Burkholderiaceae bacterium]
MYIPSHFEERRPEVLHALVRAHPLATVITLTSRGIVANHVPLHLYADATQGDSLRGHVARANPLWNDLTEGSESLAVFQGPQSYISPSWYATKKEHGKVVPTWNYCAVHAYGTLRIHDDPQWVRAQVEALTAWQESSFAQPWALTDAPREHVDAMLRQIVGIELVVTRLVGKWKLSQNQPARNRAGVLEGLDERPDANAAQMAALMREREPR